MRVRLLIAVLALVSSTSSFADDLGARALLAFQRYDSGTRTPSSGFRQQYDLRLDGAFTDTSHFRIFVRADDYRGSASNALSAKTNSRQIQPIAELMINTMNLHLQARSEVIDTHSVRGTDTSHRSIERTAGNLTFDPAGLPALALTMQRNTTSDADAQIDLVDEIGTASLSYGWRGLAIQGDETWSRMKDPRSGYDRSTTTHRGDLGWAGSWFGNRLAIAAQGDSQWMQIDERATGSQQTLVPTQQTVTRALWAIDETPLDNRDHTLTPNPSLIDGNSGIASGLTLGPEAASFQNIAIDIGRVDRVDEIRVIVRDPAGNPLRNGGGPVSWDVYTSDDGQLWTPVSGAQTEFNAPLGLYSVSFGQQLSRWVKIVNFGVNADPTIITEVQAWYHTLIQAGERRSGTQRSYAATGTVTFRPTDRTTLLYATLYNSVQQELSAIPKTSTTDLEQFLDARYELRLGLAARIQVNQRQAESLDHTRDDGDGISASLEYMPTPQLRAVAELGKQHQMLENQQIEIDTRALRFFGSPLRSITMTFDVGTQSQAGSNGANVADRQFVNVTGNAQMFPALRVLLNVSLQRVTSNDSTLQILGPTRDNRVSTDIIYRPGRPFAVSARYGWVSGPLVSGFTQRYHIEWYPFADGTVSIGGAYDQDIDPMTNRRSNRVIVNPRWLMNRWLSFDINYTSIASSFATSTARTRTFYATATLTR